MQEEWGGEEREGEGGKKGGREVVASGEKGEGGRERGKGRGGGRGGRRERGKVATLSRLICLRRGLKMRLRGAHSEGSLHDKVIVIVLYYKARKCECFGGNQ